MVIYAYKMKSDRHRPTEEFLKVAGNRLTMTNRRCQIEFLP